MPRLTTTLIAVALAQFTARLTADDLLPAPRGAVANSSPSNYQEPSRLLPTHAGRPTLANDILAPRGDVQQASHQAPALADPSNALAPNRLAPSTNASKTLELPAAPAAAANRAPSSPLPSLGTVISCLCLVLGLFFLCAWVMRKAMPQGSATLPAEVAELLGRILLAPRQHAHLIRIGNKLLLVSLSPSGAETLTEITDPLEVDRLAGICKQAHPQSSTNAFRQVFEQFATQKAPRGFLGNEGTSSRDLPDVLPASTERRHV